jgi:hypothetical protein
MRAQASRFGRRLAAEDHVLCRFRCILEHLNHGVGNDDMPALGRAESRPSKVKNDGSPCLMSNTLWRL